MIIGCRDYSNDTNPLPHGTLIVAIICNDGIIIAGDSRASFTTTHEERNSEGRKIEKVYAYIDSTQKIFQVNKYQMGVSGISMLGGKFLYQLTQDFSRKNKSEATLKATFLNLKNYLNNSLSIKDSSISENQFILAGYENSQATIFAHGYNGEVSERRLGGAVYSDSGFKPYLVKPKGTVWNCKDIAPYIESAMHSFARDKNDFMIGGPINIIQIKPDNSIIQIKSFKSTKYKNYKQMATDIINNKLSVKYLFWDSESLLKKTLREGIELGY